MSTYSTKLALNDILTHIFFFIPIDYLINVNYCLETNNNMILSRISLNPKMCFFVHHRDTIHYVCLQKSFENQREVTFTKRENF